MSIAFRPSAAGTRFGSVTVRDGNGARPDLVLSLVGVGEQLPAVGQPCGAGSRCAGGGTCERHSNGNELVCCADNCAGNEFCSQSQGFLGCELLGNRGDDCNNDRECREGSCASNGVCCDSACNRDCESCSAGGQCQFDRQRDSGCLPVDCSSEASVCQTTANIQSNLCRSRGQCKARQDCNLTNLPNRMACDQSFSDTRLCLNGQCREPVIQCNGVNGPNAGQVCCMSVLDDSSGVEERFVNSCPASSLASSVDDTRRVTCDGQNDCRLGQVCCSIRSSSSRNIPDDVRIGCVPEIQCETSGSSQVCKSPSGFSSNCPGGAACGLASVLPNTFPVGWDFCSR